MILSTLLIAALFSVFAGYIFWQMIKEKKKKEFRKMLLNAYKSLLRQNNLEANVYEMMKSSIIALDLRNKKLIAVYVDSNSLQQHAICLRNICETKIIEERNVNGNIQTITLQLKHTKENLVYEIPFFNGDYDHSTELPYMAKKALHWKHRAELYRRSEVVQFEQEYVL